MTEYRLFELKDRSRIPEICELFRKGLGETDESFWQWKYWDENGLPDSFILIAENAEHQIVGMMGMQFTDYICGERKYRMVQTQDLIIDPACRGTGLMRKIYVEAMRLCKEKGGIAYMAHPNENSLPPFLKYGAVDMGDVGFYNTKVTILPAINKIKKKSVDGYDFEIVSCVPEDIIVSESDDCFKLQKTKQFMKWRFDDNPEEKFQWLTIRKNGDLKGYFVFQCCKGRFRTAVNVYDFDYIQDIPYKALIRAVDILKTYGNWVSIWGTFSENEIKILNSIGFVEQKAGTVHFVIHPFEDTNITQCWHTTRADLDY